MLKAFITAMLVLVVIPYAFANGGNVDLDSLIERALESNAEIVSARERFAASQNRIPQAGAWEDPNFFLNFKNIPVDNPSFSRTPMSGKDVGVSQKVPTSGSKWTSKKIAKFQSEGLRAELDDVVARITWSIKHTYYELAYVNEAIVLTDNNRRIAAGLVDIARERLKSHSDAPEQEVFQAEVDHIDYSKQINDLNRRKKMLIAKLSEFVGDGGSVPTFVKMNLKSISPFSNKEDVLHMGLEDHPRIIKRVSYLRAQEKKLQLAKQKWIPDIELNFAYTLRDRVIGDPVIGEDFFSVGVKIPLPLYGAWKQGKGVLEHKALLRESQSQLNNARDNFEYMVESTFAEYERARNDISLIRNRLLPNARAALDTSIAAYKAGKIEFINVLTSQMAVYRYGRELARDRADYLSSITKINYLLAGTSVRPNDER